MYDPTRLTLEGGEYPHHVSPNDIMFHTSPNFHLRGSDNGVINDVYYNFTIMPQYDVYEWGTMHKNQPWALQLRIDNPPADKEFFFCVDDWHYSVLLSDELVPTHRYVEPGKVCL